jgi:uncharacterized protein (DUF2345 family)
MKTRLFRFLLALALVLAFAAAQAAETAKSASWLSASAKVTFQNYGATAAPATTVFLWGFKASGTLVDLTCKQITAGTTGTSVSFDVQKNGTTMLSTLGTITLAAGANVTVDAAKNVTAVSGGTRPVIKPRGAAIRVSKGDSIQIVTTESGSYSPHPTYVCEASFLPDI